MNCELFSQLIVGYSVEEHKVLKLPLTERKREKES